MRIRMRIRTRINMQIRTRINMQIRIKSFQINNTSNLTATSTLQHHLNPAQTLSNYSTNTMKNTTQNNQHIVHQNAHQDCLSNSLQSGYQNNFQNNVQGNHITVQNSVQSCLYQSNVQNNNLPTSNIQNNVMNQKNSQTAIQCNQQGNMPNSVLNSLHQTHNSQTTQLPQLQFHDQQQMIIKKERDVDLLKQQRQQQSSTIAQNQQVALISSTSINSGGSNNRASFGNLASSDSIQSNNSNHENQPQFNIDNQQVNPNLYNVQSELTIGNNPLTNRLNNNPLNQMGSQFTSRLQHTLSNYTGNQLVHQLNDPKNQTAMVPLSNNALQSSSIKNMTGNSIQLSDGLIIRSTFNNGLAAFQPINMEDQERAKQERKRLKNREAATKCRIKKMEKIQQLERNTLMLQSQVQSLKQVYLESLNRFNQLKYTLKEHMSNGCEIDEVLTQMVMNEDSTADEQNISANCQIKSDSLALMSSANQSIQEQALNYQNLISNSDVNQIIQENHPHQIQEPGYIGQEIKNQILEDFIHTNYHQKIDTDENQNYAHQHDAMRDKNLDSSEHNQIN